KNVGTGTAFDAYAALRNLSEDKINVKKGSNRLRPLKPGEMKSATFVLEVKKPLDEAVPVRLEVGDKELYEAQRDKLLLPTAPAGPLPRGGPPPCRSPRPPSRCARRWTRPSWPARRRPAPGWRR